MECKDYRLIESICDAERLIGNIVECKVRMHGTEGAEISRLIGNIVECKVILPHPPDLPLPRLIGNIVECKVRIM